MKIPLTQTYVEAYVRDWSEFTPSPDHDANCPNFRHCFANQVNCTHCGWNCTGTWKDENEGMGWHVCRVQSFKGDGNPIVLFGGALFHPEKEQWRAIVPDSVPLGWSL